MKDKRRFLILTSDSGFGHRSASKSVLKALNALHPEGAECVIVNPILETDSPRFIKNLETNYDHTVMRTPAFYRFTYEISDSRLVSDIVAGALSLALQRNIRELIRAYRPAVILNTNQNFNAPAGTAIRELDLPIPLLTAVTDLADVHAMWFHELPERFFVASDWVRIKAEESGISPEKVVISGIPVDPDFALNAQTREQARTQLGLEKDLTTVLMVGSTRVENIDKNLQALENVRFPILVVMIAGGNTALFRRIQRIPTRFPVVAQNFVNNMSEWMMAADVLITKAGGLILSESMAAGLPVAITGYIPGQEEGNLRYILGHQAGGWVANGQELASLLNYWLADDQKHLALVASCARDLGHPQAALQIAAAMWEAAGRAGRNEEENERNPK